MNGFQIELFRNRNLMMLNSLDFLFLFLPLFLAIYYLTPKKYRNVTLFLGSIAFYGVGEPFYVFFFLMCIITNYFFAGRVWSDKGNYKWRKKIRKKWLIMILFLNTGLLIAFKILHAWEENILLPLGISFFVFKMISYQVDIYKGTLKNPGFIKTAVYFSLFPQVVSGPIMRYNQIQETLEERSYKAEQIEDGIKFFILGLAGKILLADRLSLLWNEIQTIGFESISTPLAWMGAFSYSLELYFDFAGYSLMAGGICMMLGFPMIQNFHHPYAAASVREFFRRWHMSLSNWFRDYIYIPLGGNKGGRWKCARNLLLVWLLTGFWHGGSINFILWGMILFLLVALEKIGLGKWLEKYPTLGRCYVIFIMPLTWIVFAITNLWDIGTYFCRLFPFFGIGTAVNSHDFMKHIWSYGGYIAMGVICCIPEVFRKYEKYKKHPLVIIGLVVLFWLAVYTMSNATNNPFLYADF